MIHNINQMGLCHRAEKFMEQEGNSDTNGNWRSWNSSQETGKKLNEV